MMHGHAPPGDAAPMAPSPPSAQWRALTELGPYLWPKGYPLLQLRVAVSVLLIVAAKVLNALVPIALKHVVDALTLPTQALAGPVLLILIYGAARVGAQMCGELRELVFATVAQRTIRLIALKVFRHLHGLSLRFHLERQTGGLTRAIERGTTGIEYLFGLALFSLVPTIVELVLVSAILWSFYSAEFTGLTLGTVALYVGFTVLVTQWRVKVRQDMNRRDTDANTRAIDSLLNYETVKYFANEAHEAERFDQAKRAYARAAVRSQATLSLLNVGQQIIMALGLVLMLGLAGHRVALGLMTVGDFVLVNAYLLQLYQPLNFLGMVYRNVRQSLTDLEQMTRLLSVPSEIEDRPGAPDLEVTRGAITFDAVSFAYDARRPILDHVSFEILPNQTVAIVGSTGSGKSTIARLLFRFYDVGSGRILIDGQDLRDVTQHSLRRAIGVVPQDTVLFNDTIRYNIAYGRPGASHAEIEAAAGGAQLDRFIKALPDGYDTRVGERGLKLSGGEKQRVAIARVLLKAPRLLIFDEATSALDSHTEHDIQRALDDASAERSTLVIAHRLSTVIDADQILVLEAGRIAERGRHAELIAADGLYAALWRRQRAQKATEETVLAAE